MNREEIIESLSRDEGQAWDFAHDKEDNLPKDYWQQEREDVIARFTQELKKVTGDGSKKRQSGEKPPWNQDSSHESAIFSHITKWKRGFRFDPDSGAHPLVHAAWRCLAIACTETGNIPTTEGKQNGNHT